MDTETRSAVVRQRSGTKHHTYEDVSKKGPFCLFHASLLTGRHIQARKLDAIPVSCSPSSSSISQLIVSSIRRSIAVSPIPLPTSPKLECNEKCRRFVLAMARRFFAVALQMNLLDSLVGTSVLTEL
jgi:hypothetical protein